MQRRTVPLSDLATTFGGTCFRSPWMSIDRPHLPQFAYATYLDPANRPDGEQEQPAGHTLVDGFPADDMLTAFHFTNSPVAGDGLYGFNYGMDRVRFTHPGCSRAKNPRGHAGPRSSAR